MNGTALCDLKAMGGAEHGRESFSYKKEPNRQNKKVTLLPKCWKYCTVMKTTQPWESINLPINTLILFCGQENEGTSSIIHIPCQ